MMSDFLVYLKSAFAKQSEPVAQEYTQRLDGTAEEIELRAGKEQADARNREARNQAHSADNSKQLASSKPAHSFVHFQRGDQIIYEPNEVHQLKYVNERGEVNPIKGLQYIITQPNFSQGRPCHFFVVNKAEFEKASGDPEGAARLAAQRLRDQKKQQNGISQPGRSNRNSQKFRSQAKQSSQ